MLTRILLLLGVALAMAAAPVLASSPASQVSCTNEMAMARSSTAHPDCCDCAGGEVVKTCQTDCAPASAAAVLPDASSASAVTIASKPPSGWSDDRAADALPRHTDPPPRTL